MSVAPISAKEFQAWAWCTGTRRDEWEYRAMRKASTAYVVQAGKREASEPAEIEAEQKAKRPSIVGMLASINKPKEPQ